MTLDQFIDYIKQSSRENYLYHFTDEDNYDSIKKHGILSTEKRQELGITPSYRGGNTISHRADKMKQIEGYVCLCFTIYHELFTNGNSNFSNQICLKIKPEILLFDGAKFADGVANATATTLTPISEALNADLIDTKIIYETVDLRYNREMRSRRHKAKKYEILVPDVVPPSMIRGKA